MAAIAVVNYAFIPDSPKSGLLPMAVPQQWFGYIFPVPRMFEFGLGMMLARLVEAERLAQAAQDLARRR